MRVIYKWIKIKKGKLNFIPKCMFRLVFSSINPGNYKNIIFKLL
jgi:hypothetical protein